MESPFRAGEDLGDNLLTPSLFKKAFYFKRNLDLQKSCKSSVEFLYTIHSAFPNE